MGTGQQVAVGRQGVERAEETKALDELADKRVYRDHPFRLQFSEGHVNGPTIGSDVAKAIPGKVNTFTDAHTGMAQQQEDVGRQVVAAEQLLLDGLILLRRQGTGQALGRPRRILATNQMSQLRELFGGLSRFKEWWSVLVDRKQSIRPSGLIYTSSQILRWA